MPEDAIETVFARHRERIMAVPGVVGISIGDYRGRSCLHVMVVRVTREVRSQIPRVLDGYPVVVRKTGKIRPLSS